MKWAVTILVFCVAALLALGLTMLYSASMLDVMKEAGKDASVREVGAHYLTKQLIWCGLGVVTCVLTAAFDYKKLQKWSWVLFGISVVLLAIVLHPKIGKLVGGARRWLAVGGLRMQPSDLAKLVLILVVAAYAARYQRHMRSFWRGLVLPGAVIALVLGLIFVEPDRGNTILLASVTGILLIVAGVRWYYFLPPALIAVAALAYSFHKDPMRSERIYSWLHLEETKMGKGLQAYQAMIALGSGGWTGVGLGNGRQKLGFVPEHHTDFIFSIIGEELGLIATLGVVVFFILIVICGIYISVRAPDTFGMLLGSGITFLIGMQAFINIGVVTSALPNKGLSLPFISYGGSSLLTMLVGVGLLLSIARFAVGKTLQSVEVASDNPFRG